ncbi:hypothetical protein PanWU01x14_190800 [Parasponia andersonii]|uniref:Uncharacterized protein n=1 Tax=Parasponia andersonii TaxID=3476 RepID=A0A2P5C278_PARAD|nr:hypothetical protein PanWU01x14_190800 [Parasponia andersonii]
MHLLNDPSFDYERIKLEQHTVPMLLEGFKHCLQGHGSLRETRVTLQGHYDTPHLEPHSKGLPISMHTTQRLEPLHTENDIGTGKLQGQKVSQNIEIGQRENYRIANFGALDSDGLHKDAITSSGLLGNAQMLNQLH